MSKFCSSCGSQMGDEEKFCPSCGSPQSDVSNQSGGGEIKGAVSDLGQSAKAFAGAVGGKIGDAVSANPTLNELNKKPLKTKLLMLVGIIVALVLVITLLGILFTPGYKKPINKFCNAMEKGDMEKLLKTFPEVVQEQMEDEYDSGDLEDMGEAMLEGLEDEYGNNVKISFKVDSKRKLDKDDLNDIEDYFDETYDENVKVTKAYKVKGEMRTKGKDDEDDETMDVYVAKVDGKWCIDPSQGDLATLLSLMSYGLY